jgi:hypothetical protein
MRGFVNIDEKQFFQLSLRFFAERYHFTREKFRRLAWGSDLLLANARRNDLHVNQF